MAALPYSSCDALTRGCSARGGSQLDLYSFTLHQISHLSLFTFHFPLFTTFPFSHAARGTDRSSPAVLVSRLPAPGLFGGSAGRADSSDLHSQLKICPPRHCAASASRHPAGFAARLCPRSRQAEPAEFRKCSKPWPAGPLCQPGA